MPFGEAIPSLLRIAVTVRPDSPDSSISAIRRANGHVCGSRSIPPVILPGSGP
jgi:hypothetical protein